jgi:hypothetical protein
MDANAHSDALLTNEILFQTAIGFSLCLFGLFYNLRIRSITTGSDVKGKTFVESFAENDYRVFTGRRKQVVKLHENDN